MKKLLVLVFVVVSLLVGLFGYQAVSANETDNQPVVIEQVEYVEFEYLPVVQQNRCLEATCMLPPVCIVDPTTREYVPCEDEQ